MVRVLRAIMNLVPVNRFMREVTGDVGALPWVGAWAHIVLLGGELMLLFAEDQRCMFYLYALPGAWRRWFYFARKVSGRWVGLETDAMVPLRSEVVPMGWLLAVMVAQHVHRNQMIWEGPGAGLSAAEEWRKDRLVPLVLSELVRRWWQVYVDNWDAGTVGPWAEMAKLVGLPDDRQEAVRRAWASGG